MTKEELELILRLCDLALKTDGLSAVNTILPLVGKCQTLIADLQAPPSTEE